MTEAEILAVIADSKRYINVNPPAPANIRPSLPPKAAPPAPPKMRCVKHGKPPRLIDPARFKIFVFGLILGWGGTLIWGMV